MRGVLLCLATAVLLPVAVSAQDAATAPSSQNVRMFLDCSFFCDETFLRQELTVVDWVRDRKDADVHVLVTTQETGGGGREYTVQFIGAGRFAGVEQTLKYLSISTSTSDEVRRGMLDVLKRGLVRYVTESPAGARLRISYEPETPATRGDPARDPWNLWVYRTSIGGDMNGERSNKSRALRGSASANRTTDDWRMSFSGSGSYRSSTYELSETETFSTISRHADGSATVVKSLSQHWSVGLVASASMSTFSNFDLRLRVAPGIEFNVFPYSQSTRRMFTLQYTVGADRFDYQEETIFGKFRESMADHKLDVSLSLRQPWGTASGSVDYTQYLNKPEHYRLSAYGSTNVRLFKGLSFSVFGEASRTRDQFYLPRAGATPEEILVRQQQLATGYSYHMRFSVAYSFGSIFNNIVNPRFGGGGGDFIIF